MTTRHRTFSALVIAALSGGCVEEPVVTLGSGNEIDARVDENASVEEQTRERLFIELAKRECREDEPVCGANGTTYRNLCHALTSGIESFVAGSCPADTD